MAQDRRVMAQDRRMDLGWVDAALAGGGIPSVPGNGRPRVDLGSAVRQALLRARADSWIWRAVYEPLRMRGLWADPRAEKYFFATSMSAMLLERAYGRKGEPVSGVPLRILHRHAVLTCYLDAVVDSGPIEWARGFGMAVVGLAAAPPPFLETHSAEFRRAIEEDMPRLRLAAESPHKAAMMRSLLDAADAESTRACEGFEGAFRYKARSNLACIRPFIPSLGPLLEPLAAVYSFFGASAVGASPSCKEAFTSFFSFTVAFSMLEAPRVRR